MLHENGDTFGTVKRSMLKGKAWNLSSQTTHLSRFCCLFVCLCFCFLSWFFCSSRNGNVVYIPSHMKQA